MQLYCDTPVVKFCNCIVTPLYLNLTERLLLYSLFLWSLFPYLFIHSFVLSFFLSLFFSFYIHGESLTGHLSFNAISILLLFLLLLLIFAIIVTIVTSCVRLNFSVQLLQSGRYLGPPYDVFPVGCLQSCHYGRP